MRRAVSVMVLAAAAALSVAVPADAGTAWAARISGHGAATLYPGSSARLVVSLSGYGRGSAWAVSLRRGSCASAGTLVVSTRLVASSTGRLARTLTLTAAQSRAAKSLPLALRVGSSCAPLTAPAIFPGVFADGTWRVGPAPVVPGTYRTAGGPTCYWARLSGFGGTLDEIITSAIGSGPAVVAIDSTDAGFKADGCGTWHLDAPAVGTAAPGDGTWRVGADIAPGTYQASSAGAFCYWARLSGFAGTLDDVVTSALGTGIVTIDPTDVGFKSSGCGTWTSAP